MTRRKIKANREFQIPKVDISLEASVRKSAPRECNQRARDHLWARDSPCRRSSWSGGWRRPSPRCSARAPGRSRPPARRAVAPAGTRCSWWRYAGSPPWEASGWGSPSCSASGSRRRRWLCWAAGAPAVWPPSAGPRSWSFACRPCRPRAGSGPPGGARWGRGRARRRPPPRCGGGAKGRTGRRRRRKGRMRTKRRSRRASAGPHGPAAGPGPRRSACRWCWSRGRRRSHQRRGSGKRYPTTPWFSPQTHRRRTIQWRRLRGLQPEMGLLSGKRDARGANMGREAGSVASGECRVRSQTVLSPQLLTWIFLYLRRQRRRGSGWWCPPTSDQWGCSRGFTTSQ